MSQMNSKALIQDAQRKTIGFVFTPFSLSTPKSPQELAIILCILQISEQGDVIARSCDNQSCSLCPWQFLLKKEIT